MPIEDDRRRLAEVIKRNDDAQALHPGPDGTVAGFAQEALFDAAFMRTDLVLDHLDPAAKTLTPQQLMSVRQSMATMWMDGFVNGSLSRAKESWPCRSTPSTW